MTPTRRHQLLTGAIPVVLTGAALVLGLVPLHDVFRRERDETLARIGVAQRSLGALAGRIFMRNVKRQLENARTRFESIEADPLESDDGIFWRDEQHRVRLPRPAPSGERDSSPVVAELWRRLDDGRFYEDGDALFAERLAALDR